MLRRWVRLQVSQVHTSRPFSTPCAQVIRASAAASVPQLRVSNVGQDAETTIEVADLKPWKLDIDLEEERFLRRAHSDLTEQPPGQSVKGQILLNYPINI